MAEASDEELVEAFRGLPGGDVRAFDALVLRHQERVLANCRFLTASPDDAEDLAQEVFVKAFFGLNRFEGRSSFKTWLQQIKINHCLNFNEARRRRGVAVDLEEPGLEATPDLHTAATAERDLRAGRDRQRIAAILDSMSETLRVPLILRDADGLQYQEIADRIGISLSATKMRIKRAREEFRARYEAISAEAIQ